eukprot:scaffold206964_cov49-Prasinocladus_malaysianus.AAC.2
MISTHGSRHNYETRIHRSKGSSVSNSETYLKGLEVQSLAHKGESGRDFQAVCDGGSAAKQHRIKLI